MTRRSRLGGLQPPSTDSGSALTVHSRMVNCTRTAAHQKKMCSYCSFRCLLGNICIADAFFAMQPWWVYKAENDAHLWSVFRVASDISDNSCLILISQKALQCKGEKDTTGGNQNRDWGRHIGLAQSKKLGIQKTGNIPRRFLLAQYFFFFFLNKGTPLMDIQRGFENLPFPCYALNSV